jgi:hypothetical protein
MFIIEALASIALSIALSMGVGVTETQAPIDSVSIQCEEDMECWDSSTMGNKQAGMDNEQDAWHAVDTLQIVPATPNQALEYVTTLDYFPAELPFDQFAVTSYTQPHKVHVMQWVTLYYA